MENGKMLVLGCHAVDFVWRAAGTIAAYADSGWDVKIIDMSCGARGEAEGLWASQPNIAEEEIKERCKNDAIAAAEVLGATIEFLEWSDHPLEVDRERMLILARKIKEYRPQIILAQCENDPWNVDHTTASRAAIGAVRCARVAGVFPELPKIPPPKFYLFDTTHPECCDFKPDVFIDITAFIDKKVAAMTFASNVSSYLVEQHKARALYRGTNARAFSGDKNIRYAEAFTRFSPYVGAAFQ